MNNEKGGEKEMRKKKGKGGEREWYLDIWIRVRYIERRQEKRREEEKKREKRVKK